MNTTYLSLNGIPTKAPREPEELYFLRDNLGSWNPNQGNYLYEIDDVCVLLHNSLDKKIIGNCFNPPKVSSINLSTVGINSESNISKDELRDLLKNSPSDTSLNKALYLTECRKLVTSIQECAKEVMQIQGEFYLALNLEELSLEKMHSPYTKESDGIKYVTLPVVTKIHALLGFIYIRMHSLLDYVTKLAVEIEDLKTEFDTYISLKSKNVTYGSKKNISLNNKIGTLFEKCPLLNEVATVRNHVIHSGLIDDMPKVYRVISNGECVEKFILFPDQGEEGYFESFGSRSLFYSKEDKINLRLPSVTSEFQKRLLSTLKHISKKI